MPEEIFRFFIDRHHLVKDITSISCSSRNVRGTPFGRASACYECVTSGLSCCLTDHYFAVQIIIHNTTTIFCILLLWFSDPCLGWCYEIGNRDWMALLIDNRASNDAFNIICICND